MIPLERFNLISLLGTDHLETYFGLVWTAIGTDANVDMLQLKAMPLESGLTEVAAILTEHPKWDYGPCHLALPVFSKETKDFTSKADHLSPQDWCGDVSVLGINLHTCWLLEQKHANELIPETEAILSELPNTHPSVDMLSPFGNLLVNQHNEPILTDAGLASEASEEGEPAALSLVSRSVPFTHEGDLKDAIADEVPCSKNSLEIFIQGEKTTKVKALQQH